MLLARHWQTNLHFCFCFSDSLDWIGYDEKFKGKLFLTALGFPLRLKRSFPSVSLNF